MRRRRQLYLRKTPVDKKVEEIMRANDCSLTDAQKIYQEEFGRTSLLQVNAFATGSSPVRKREVLGDITENGNRLLQSVYKTILEKISPSRLNPSQSMKENECIQAMHCAHISEGSEEKSSQISSEALFQDNEMKECSAGMTAKTMDPSGMLVLTKDISEVEVQGKSRNTGPEATLH
jgi:hypothetical protein